MKKICLIILLLLSFSPFSFGKEKKNDSEWPKLKIEAYKDEYIQGQPIIILYEISANRNYKFCLEPKYYVFSINMETMEGKSLTNSSFTNWGATVKEKRPMIVSPSQFIDLKFDETDNKKFIFRSYISLLEIIGEHLPLLNLNHLKLGIYNLTLRITPYGKKYYSNSTMIEVENAWVGEMTSNTIQIKIVEDKKLKK